MLNGNPYKWHYHDKTRNETSDALKVALENKCGLLVFVAKPGCSICETVWGKSHNGTAMMDGTGKMAEYLKNHKLVGLKIEDSQSHFSDLASGAMGYRNADKKATNTNAPFLVLVKVKAGSEGSTKFGIGKKSSNVEVFFGGYGSLKMEDKTYAKISAWLDSLLGSSAYRSAFPGASEPVQEITTDPAPAPSPKKQPRWTVTAKMTFQMTSEYEASTVTEAKALAKKDLEKWSATCPKGWNGTKGGVTVLAKKSKG